MKLFPGADEKCEMWACLKLLSGIDMEVVFAKKYVIK